MRINADDVLGVGKVDAAVNVDIEAEQPEVGPEAAGQIDLPQELSVLIPHLGDVLWYIAQVATELDLSLDEIAEYNITKLYDRLERGKIKGDGDNR